MEDNLDLSYSVICVHVFMCMILLILILLGVDLVTQQLSHICCRTLILYHLLFMVGT